MYLSLDNQKMTLELPDSDFSPLYLTASICIIDSIKVTTTGRISNVKFKGILIHFVVIEFEATLHEQSDGVWTAVYENKSGLIDPKDNPDFRLSLLDDGALNEFSFKIVANNYKINEGPYTIYITTPPSNN